MSRNDQILLQKNSLTDILSLKSWFIWSGQGANLLDFTYFISKASPLMARQLRQPLSRELPQHFGWSYYLNRKANTDFIEC